MRHNNALDNLRGYAALTVVMLHFSAIPMSITSQHKFLSLYSYFIPGHQAVILFFILSGYVLSLSMDKSKDNNYFTFMIKRVFRIMPLYVVVITFLLLLYYVSTPEVISRYRGIDADLPITFDVSFFVKSFTLIGSIFLPYITSADSISRSVGFPLNVPTWTLSYELAISFIFPLLYKIYNRSSIKSDFLNFIFHLTLSITLILYFKSPILYILYYSIYFVIGIIVYKYRDIVFRLISKNYFILIGSVLFVLPANKLFFVDNEIIGELVSSIGAIILISLCNTNILFTKVINKFSLFNIGRNSYSIYLIHMPVSFLSFYLFINFMHLNVSGVYSLVNKIATILLLLLLSNLSYNYIEKPFMNLGRRIVNLCNL